MRHIRTFSQSDYGMHLLGLIMVYVIVAYVAKVQTHDFPIVVPPIRKRYELRYVSGAVSHVTWYRIVDLGS